MEILMAHGLEDGTYVRTGGVLQLRATAILSACSTVQRRWKVYPRVMQINKRGCYDPVTISRGHKFLTMFPFVWELWK